MNHFFRRKLQKYPVTRRRRLKMNCEGDFVSLSFQQLLDVIYLSYGGIRLDSNQMLLLNDSSY